MKEAAKQLIVKLARILRRHALACVIMIFVGVTSIAPHLLAQKALGTDYQGFPLLFGSNEDYYLAKIQDVIEGYWLASSPYLYEYKNDLPIVFPTGEYFYALPAMLFGVSALSVLMAAKFIFPALLFLLVYILLYNLSKRARGDKIIAAFGGLLITLGIHFVNYKDTWFILTGQSSDLFLSMWTRPVNPITGALLLFIFFILLWKSICSEKWRYPIASGIILGIMPGYIFSWMAALSVGGAVVIISLIRRRFEIIKKMLLAVLGGVLAGMPIWYLWFRSIFAAEGGQYTASRLGLMLTHYPILNKEVLAQTVFFLALFLFEWRRKKKNSEKFEEWWWFAAALVLGNWLVYNQQIITGRVVWPPHLTQYTSLISFLTFVLVLGNYFKTHVPKLWQSLIIGISGVILLFVGMTTVNYSSELQEFTARQRLVSFFEWVNNQTSKDCVILVKEDNAKVIERWIPAFTHCNTYSTDYYPTSTPLEQIYFNYVVNLRLQGVERKDLEQYLWDQKARLRSIFYTTWSQAFTPTDDSWLVGPINTIIDNYDALLEEDFITALKRYRIDYIASEELLSEPLMKQLPSANLLGQFGSVFVYQL